jgi:RNA polymerase sigma factor (sigma-70 family)
VAISVQAYPATTDWPAVNNATCVDFDDESLVKAAQHGDRSAFGLLYQHYVRMVHGILLSRVPSMAAEDLVHDVFLQALPRMKSLRDTSRFGPWLAAIARNRAMDFHRRAKPDSALDDQVASIEGSRKIVGTISPQRNDSRFPRRGCRAAHSAVSRFLDFWVGHTTRCRDLTPSGAGRFGIAPARFSAGSFECTRMGCGAAFRHAAGWTRLVSKRYQQGPVESWPSARHKQ